MDLSALPPSNLWSAELGWSCLYSLQISAPWKFFWVNQNLSPPILNCTMPALCQQFHNRWAFMQPSNKRKDLMVSQFVSPQMISTYIRVQFPALLAVYAVYNKSTIGMEGGQNLEMRSSLCPQFVIWSNFHFACAWFWPVNCTLGQTGKQCLFPLKYLLCLCG